MATTKVGIYRSYFGPIPKDKSGQPLPKALWPEKRQHSWVVRWFGLDRNRYSKSFPTRKEADRFAETKQSDVRRGKADALTQISLRDFYKEHGVLMKGNLAPKTLHMHLAVMALLAGSVGWNRSVNRISVRDVERFRAERLDTEISPSTANREIKTLKRVFNLAAVRGYIPRDTNPCTSVPMIKVGRKRPPYCGPEEFRAVYHKASDVLFRALLVTIYTTGLRLREAMNLTWGDIDFEAGQLHVTRKSAEGWVQAWTPKDHERRTIPLPPQAVNLLSGLHAVAPVECPYVFMDLGVGSITARGSRPVVGRPVEI